jgi:hypothetical protein
LPFLPQMFRLFFLSSLATASSFLTLFISCLVLWCLNLPSPSYFPLIWWVACGSLCLLLR